MENLKARKIGKINNKKIIVRVAKIEKTTRHISITILH